MYVWAAFEAKLPPTCPNLVTLFNNYTLYALPMRPINQFEPEPDSKADNRRAKSLLS